MTMKGSRRLTNATVSPRKKIDKAQRFETVLRVLDARARVNDLQPQARAIYAIAWSRDTGRMPTPTLKKLQNLSEPKFINLVNKMADADLRLSESTKWLIDNV